MGCLLNRLFPIECAVSSLGQWPTRHYLALLAMVTWVLTPWSVGAIKMNSMEIQQIPFKFNESLHYRSTLKSMQVIGNGSCHGKAVALECTKIRQFRSFQYAQISLLSLRNESSIGPQKTRRGELPYSNSIALLCTPAYDLCAMEIFEQIEVTFLHRAFYTA